MCGAETSAAARVQAAEKSWGTGRAPSCECDA